METRTNHTQLFRAERTKGQRGLIVAPLPAHCTCLLKEYRIRITTCLRCPPPTGVLFSSHPGRRPCQNAASNMKAGPTERRNSLPISHRKGEKQNIQTPLATSPGCSDRAPKYYRPSNQNQESLHTVFLTRKENRIKRAYLSTSTTPQRHEDSVETGQEELSHKILLHAKGKQTHSNNPSKLLMSPGPRTRTHNTPRHPDTRIFRKKM